MKKTVLITGAGRGIGAACAELFAKHNYKVAINYFKSELKAKQLSNKINKNGGCCEIFYADVSNPNDVKKMHEEIKSKLGNPEVLINNAGIAQQKLFTDITLDDWEKMINTNTKSVFLCCKEFLPYMIHEKKGKIINISSIWGVIGGSCEVHYSASKAAIIGFSKALAKEMALSGITVNCIAPGVIDTDMNSMHSKQTMDILKQEIACGKIGSAQDVAHTALFLASDEASYITGQVINVDGGF